jgi:hypothetical protein
MSSKESAPASRTTPKKIPRSQKPVGSSRSDLHPGPDLPEEKKVIRVNRLYDYLAVVQVVSATNVPHGYDSLGEWIAPSSAALYQDFQAADPVDSILARLMVGISNMSMDALSRATRTDRFDVRELELKSATKGALVVAELAKAYDARRDREKRTVNVGQVNVEAGGQAVVGNVNPGARPPKPQAAGAQADTGETTQEERQGATPAVQRLYNLKI